MSLKYEPASEPPHLEAVIDEQLPWRPPAEEMEISRLSLSPPALYLCLPLSLPRLTNTPPCLHVKESFPSPGRFIDSRERQMADPQQ